MITLEKFHFVTVSSIRKTVANFILLKVMSLSQTQIDEAMRPARYDSRISAVGGHSTTVSDPVLPTSSILTKDKPFSSGASPINSLLAGEKIQFGTICSYKLSFYLYMY